MRCFDLIHVRSIIWICQRFPIIESEAGAFYLPQLLHEKVLIDIYFVSIGWLLRGCLWNHQVSSKETSSNEVATENHEGSLRNVPADPWHLHFRLSPWDPNANEG